MGKVFINQINNFLWLLKIFIMVEIIKDMKRIIYRIKKSANSIEFALEYF